MTERLSLAERLKLRREQETITTSNKSVTALLDAPRSSAMNNTFENVKEQLKALSPEDNDLEILREEDTFYNSSDEVIPYDDRESLSAFTIYLREIGKIPLLTFSQEVELSKKISSDEEEISQQAKEELVTHNLRLVVSLAKFYQNRGASIEDLVQLGNLGLMSAAERYEGDRGFRFSTYAGWWIRQAITRGLQETGREIRLPTHFHESISKIKKAENELILSLGRKPTDQEIAKHLQIKEEKVTKVKSVVTTFSADKIVDDTETPFSHFLSDNGKGEEEIDKHISELEAKALVTDILSTVSNREKVVLSYRYGVLGAEQLTYEQIAKKCGVSKSAIQQIEKKAMKNITNHLSERGLLHYQNLPFDN